MNGQVAAFTDSYLPTVNGVTYTVKSWSERWNRAHGRMDVVYPDSEHTPSESEHPVRSVDFPLYEGYRLGTPQVPRAVDGADVIHSHTAFALGLGALRLARKRDVPFVASYHTPAGEYTGYLPGTERIAKGFTRIAEGYERWFYGTADLVAPSQATRDHLVDTVGVSTPVEVLSNGIDTEQFRPVDGTAFREEYDLGDGPLVGYTGRHGHEKRLSDVLDAVEGMGDVTVVFGGDGPARESLAEQARSMDVDVTFLGFLDREELPAFYSALDVFAFPSPVETQGLVALEANACGTPVVGVDSGALSGTVVDGETGYHYQPGDIEGFRGGIERALSEREALSANCLDRREEFSIDATVETLASVYASLT